MKNTSAKITLFLVCILLGFLLTLQLKSVKINKEQAATPTRSEELMSLLVDEQQRNEQLIVQLDQYKEENDRFRNEIKETGGAASVLEAKLTRAEILSGQCAVQGKGITVTLKDSMQENTGINENAFVVHDTDLLRVINELRSAGAEAISLNGERIIATSEIRCAGPVVSVNNRKYNTPFVISAIGDPDTMESALKMRGGIVDELVTFSITVDIQKHENIVIEALRYDVAFSHAQPIEEE